MACKSSITVEGVVHRFLIATGKGGIPDYVEHNYVFDISDDEDLMLTADYLSPFEGRAVRITIEVLDAPEEI
jgi:hypothetical protein